MEFYKSFFKLKLMGDKDQPYPQSGLINKNLKSRCAERQRQEIAKQHFKGFFLYNRVDNRKLCFIADNFGLD